MNNISEQNFGVEGFLRLTKIFLDGSSECVLDEKNTIVNGGKLLLLRQLYYASGSGDSLSYAKVGTGGWTGVAPKPTLVTMTDLYTSTTTTSIAKIAEDTSTPTITLTANLDNSQGNGLAISEAGFFSGTGTMFNIKTFTPVNKDSSFSLILQWVIKVS